MRPLPRHHCCFAGVLRARARNLAHEDFDPRVAARTSRVTKFKDDNDVSDIMGWDDGEIIDCFFEYHSHI